MNAIKRKIKSNAFKLTKELLSLLLEMPGELFDIFTDKRSYIGRLYPNRQISLKQINRALQDLEKQRLVRMKKYRGTIKYELTDLGKAKALKWSYKGKPKIARTDGLSTIVIFDIPEEQKRARDFLRRFLKQNDFTQLQKSVFMGRFKLHEDFKLLLRELKISPFVSILEGRVLHD